MVTSDQSFGRATVRARRWQPALSTRLLPPVFVSTITFRVTFDPVERAETLARRGLDFEDAAVVFEGVTIEVQDTRRDESRVICYGILFDRVDVICYTQRGHTRHVFSMRKANAREKARLAPYFED